MITVQTIFPGKCSEDQLDSIIERLFALHCEIFEGVNKKVFGHYVVHSRADWTKILVFKSKDALIGYLAVHYFNVRTDGRELVVFRGETGLLREYRKQVNMTKYIIREAVRCKLKNVGREVVVLGCFLNPVMYYAVSRYLYEMYPNCREPVPTGINNLMERLGEIFHLDKIKGEKPFVRQVRWRLKESEEEHETLLVGNKDEIVFYLEQNPRYRKGYGLEIVIPITFTNLIVSFFNSLVIKAAPGLRYFKKTPLK